MKKLGFTLAEVLITLVIIGVIAAMTIPTLKQNTEGLEYKSAFRKAVSALNQALTLNYALEGVAVTDMESSSELADVLKNRLSTVENPEGATVDHCNGGTLLTTADGMIYCIAIEDPKTCDIYNQDPCGKIYVDVNGMKRPNQLTESSKRPRDVYELDVYSQKVIPGNKAAQEIMYDKPVGSGTSGSSGGSNSGGSTT